MRSTFSLLALALLVVASLPETSSACQVCFGDPESPMTKGAEAGIWFLLAVVLAVQAGFALFFVYLFRRSRYYPDGSLKPGLRLVKH